MTIYVRPGIDPVAQPCRIGNLLNPLKNHGYGHLSHVEDVPFEIHLTLSLFKSNFRI